MRRAGSENQGLGDVEFVGMRDALVGEHRASEEKRKGRAARTENKRSERKKEREGMRAKGKGQKVFL